MRHSGTQQSGTNSDELKVPNPGTINQEDTTDSYWSKKRIEQKYDYLKQIQQLSLYGSNCAVVHVSAVIISRTKLLVLMHNI